MTDEPPTILNIGAIVWLNDKPRRQRRNPIGFQGGNTMGHPYRQRHQTPATTTSSDVAGLGTGTNDATGNATWNINMDLTLEQLKAEATNRDLPTYGTKQDLIDRITTHDNQN